MLIRVKFSSFNPFYFAATPYRFVLEQPPKDNLPLWFILFFRRDIFFTMQKFLGKNWMRRKLSLFSHSILDLRMMGRLCPIEFNTILLLYLIHSIRVELHWPSNSYRHSERLIFLSNLWVIFRFHTNFQLVNQWVFDGQYDFALRLQILNITLDPFKSISSHRKIFNFVRKKSWTTG